MNKSNYELGLRLRKSNLFKKQKIRKQVLRGTVYLLESDGYYKIGRTTDLISRFGKTPQATDNPHQLELIYAKEVDGYVRVEETLHDVLIDFRVRGEWYDLNDKQLQMVITGINTL